MLDRKFVDLLLVKTAANLRTEVSRYYLNYLWWVLEPVLTMAVFYLVFGVFLQRGTEHFVAFLLCGLTAWLWFSRTVQNSAGSIANARRLMLQVDIPKVFFPLETFLRDGFKHLFVLALLLLFLVLYPTPVTVTWAALPVVLLVQGVFSLGIAILAAGLVPFVPDLRFVIATTLQLMFFASGIFYDIESMVPPEYHDILYLNPMVVLIKAYRDILMVGQWPEWPYLFNVLIFGLGLLWTAVALLRRADRIYPRLQ